MPPFVPRPGALLAVFAALVFAVPAATQPYKATRHEGRFVRTDMDLSMRPKLGDPAGCIAGSLGRPLPRGDKRDLMLRLHSSDREKHLAFAAFADDRGERREVEEADAVRDLFTLCVKPGRYERLSFVLLVDGVHYEQAKPFAVAIEVKPDTTTYLGSFSVHGAESDGCSLSTSPRVVLVDRSASDRVVLEARARKRGHAFEVAVLDATGLAPNLVRCPAEPGT